MRKDVWFNRDEPLILDLPWLTVRRNGRDYFPGLIRLRQRLCGTEGDFLLPGEGEHRHRVYHFIYCAEGSNAVRVGGRIRSFSRGEYFMINPGIPHNLNPHDSAYARYYAFTFQYRCGESELDWPWERLVPYLTGVEIDGRGIVRDREGPEEVLHDFLMDLIEPALWDRGDLGRRFMEFLLQFFVRPAVGKKGVDHRRLIDLTPTEKGAAYIRDNYDKKLSLADISQAAGITKGHFIERFRRESGKTPMDFLTDYRLDRASYMLCHGCCTQQEIAFRCGFSSDSYFNKVFRSRKGVTPGEYRKRFRD